MASAASAKFDSGKDPQLEMPSSVPGLCLEAALKHRKQDALNHKIGGKWINISAEIFVDRVRNLHAVHAADEVDSLPLWQHGGKRP